MPLRHQLRLRRLPTRPLAPKPGATPRRLPAMAVPTRPPAMNDHPTPTLDDWMARLADGDRSAFKPVFEQLWPPVLRLCRAMLKHDADAADAAQQAMEKVFTRASQYDPSRAAMPWALALASWECRTLIQKRRRRRELPPDAAPDLGAGEGDEAHVQRQLVATAIEALGTLSLVDQETLIATYWDEAATVGGATLRKRRGRALARLRDTWKRLYGID